MNFENSEKQNFVSPEICKRLQEAGLPDDTLFYWVVNGPGCELSSDLFDSDNYYALTREVLKGIGVKQTIPAYTAGYLASLLPDYYFEKRDNKYRIHIDNMYAVPPAEATDLADAFAKIAVEVLRLRIIKIPITSKSGS